MDRRRLVLVALVVASVIATVVVIGRAGDTPAPPPATDRSDPADRSATSTTGPPPDDGGPSMADGFPRSPDGAVAAATAYGLALDGREVFDPAHRTAVLDDIAADDSHDDLAATFTQGLEVITEQLHLDERAITDPDFVWRAVPGGWQLREYQRSEATVAIWAAVLVSADEQLLAAPAWRTSVVTVTWERDGWRLVGFETEPGPDPLVASAGGVPTGQRINGFASYRHWPATDAEDRP